MLVYSLQNHQNKNMQTLTQPLIGLFAISTLLGVCLHDMRIDKAMVHALTHIEGGSDSKVSSVSSNPHTHTERTSYNAKSHAVRDPRDDTARPQGQTDYFRLPGSADTDHTLRLL